MTTMIVILVGMVLAFLFGLCWLGVNNTKRSTREERYADMARAWAQGATWGVQEDGPGEWFITGDGRKFNPYIKETK